LIGDEHYGMGYEGIVKYGRRIADAIENDEFVKNLAKHTVIPYSNWWLEKEPYAFLGTRALDTSVVGTSTLGSEPEAEGF
jgi:nitrogenase molybdenum-iron protein alpha chain